MQTDSAALSLSLPHQDGLLQHPFEVRKHLLIVHVGKQDAGKAHFPGLHWGLSWWSWEMHVLAATTPVKQTALRLPHSTEQGSADLSLC